MSFERVMRWALVSIAITGLAAGLAAALAGRPALADLCWTLATLPVIAGLAVSMARDLLAGRRLAALTSDLWSGPMPPGPGTC